MPALITLPINNQMFELIRDQIAIILTMELDNQYVLTYDPAFSSIDVFVEGNIAEDKVSLPVLNVSFIKGVYGDNKDYSGTTKGVYRYNIDAYVNAKDSQSIKGDKRAALLLERILGACRAIVDHPVYKTLAFTPGFIWRVNSKEIDIRDNKLNDALNSGMGRLMIEVQASETMSMPGGILLAGSDTHVKINDSDQGLYYTVNS